MIPNETKHGASRLTDKPKDNNCPHCGHSWNLHDVTAPHCDNYGCKNQYPDGFYCDCQEYEDEQIDPELDKHEPSKCVACDLMPTTPKKIGNCTVCKEPVFNDDYIEDGNGNYTHLRC